MASFAPARGYGRFRRPEASGGGRAQSQQTTRRLSQLSRSCIHASFGASERTCSMNSSWPPGRSTRCISRSARG